MSMTWIHGVVQCADLGPMQIPSRGCLVFFLLYQDLVTTSIAIEPGGLNYDLDTWG